MEKSTCKAIPSNRLKFFPIMMFAVVMGLSGLTIVFQKAASILGFWSLFGNLFAGVDLIVFITIFLFYVMKGIKYFDEVKKEFAHPVRINFFAASSISFLLLCIVFHDIHSGVSHIFMYIGIIMQTFFTFYTIRFWINNNLEIQHSNPAWFIPIVGNVLVPIAGVKIACIEVLVYFYAVGMFFWVILMAILLNRIIFHHQLVQKLCLPSSS